MPIQITQLLTNAVDLIKTNEPFLSGTLASIQLISKGKQLFTYLIGWRQTEENSSPITPKDHIGLVVEITRPAVRDVARFLEAQEIDANLILITRDKEQSGEFPFLDPTNPEAWQELVQEFSQSILKTQSEIGSVNYHIFLAAPVAMVFGMGTMWGTVNKATVYHWQDGSYYPSMPISRHLRS